MTRIATATPRGDCARWRAFLGDVTGGDADLQAYLQRMAGYCLTGATSAHALFFLYGTGANGKSVFVKRVLVQAPALPEAHVNLGFALLGLGEVAQARRAFDTAIELRPQQANAYYGLALAQESLGDLELALGAMRSYLHLGRGESEDHQRRARAALWEWEAQLGERRHAARR